MRIEDVLSRLTMVKQTRTGAADWMARCPAHNDGRPSLHVSIARDGKVLLKCFAGCETSSIASAIGIELRDLFDEDDRGGLVVPFRLNLTPRPIDYVKPKPTNHTGITGMAYDFLLSREIDPDFAATFGITGDNRAIRFPFYRDGELINVKTRLLAKKDFFTEKDAEMIFFGLDDAKQELERGAKALVIVEGELDWLSVKMAGWTAVLSVPNAGGAVDLPWVHSAMTLIEQFPRVILALDSDEPGQRLQQKLIATIGPRRCSRAEWAEGCNDANEVHIKHGIDGVKSCLRLAKPVPVAGLINPLAVVSDYKTLYDNGLQRGESTGWASVDELYTVVKKYITLITGVPGSGKSEWLDNLMINLAINRNWKFAVFSPENKPHEEHLARWAQKLVRMPFFPGRTERMQWKQALVALEWANEHLRFVSPDEPSTKNILDMVRSEKKFFGIDAFVIDPFNEIDDGQEAMGRDDKYLSATIRKIRMLTEELELHCFIVNHPHAIQKNGEGQYPPVDIYDLHGGSMWPNKVGAIVSVWRDTIDPEAPIKLYVKKAKTQRIGRRGRAELKYDRITGTYSDTGVWELGG